MDSTLQRVKTNVITDEEYRRLKVLNTISYLQVHKGYKFVKKVGHGTFGAVIEFYIPDKRCSVAAKIVLQELVSNSESEIWPELGHDNILSLTSVEHITSTSCYVFITPLHPASLNVVVESSALSKDKQGFEKAISWLRGVCLGVQYLHNRKLSHLDIKLSNVLISADERALLCDFGSLSNTELPTSRLETHFLCHYA